MQTQCTTAFKIDKGHKPTRTESYTRNLTTWYDQNKHPTQSSEANQTVKMQSSSVKSVTRQYYMSQLSLMRQNKMMRAGGLKQTLTQLGQKKDRFNRQEMQIEQTVLGMKDSIKNWNQHSTSNSGLMDRKVADLGKGLVTAALAASISFTQAQPTLAATTFSPAQVEELQNNELQFKFRENEPFTVVQFRDEYQVAKPDQPSLLEKVRKQKSQNLQRQNAEVDLIEPLKMYDLPDNALTQIPYLPYTKEDYEVRIEKVKTYVFDQLEQKGIQLDDEQRAQVVAMIKQREKQNINESQLWLNPQQPIYDAERTFFKTIGYGAGVAMVLNTFDLLPIPESWNYDDTKEENKNKKYKGIANYWDAVFGSKINRVPAEKPNDEPKDFDESIFK